MQRNSDFLAEIKAGVEAIGRRHEEANRNREREIEGLIETNNELRQRLEDLESRAGQPGRAPSGERLLNGRHKDAFCNYLRNPRDGATQVRLREIETEVQNRLPPERKDVSIATPSAGGFAVPEEIMREIERLEKKFSPVRDLVRVTPTGTSDFKFLVNIRGASATMSAWVGELGTRSATTTPQLREVTPTHGELYAYPMASQWSLDDIFFDVAGWLSEEVAQEFAIQEGDAVIRGNGTSKPTGMLNTTPTTAADFASPLRAAEVYQYIASGGIGSPLAPAITADSLITLMYAVNSAYRSNATWVMNSNTISAVRKLKDSNGQYLWQMGIAAGQPETLLGYPLRAWEQMDDATTNNFPIAFGDFRRGYTMPERIGLRILRDEVSSVGFTKFYIRRRVGGKPANNDAVKFLKFALT